MFVALRYDKINEMEINARKIAFISQGKLKQNVNRAPPGRINVSPAAGVASHGDVVGRSVGRIG